MSTDRTFASPELGLDGFFPRRLTSVLCPRIESSQAMKSTYAFFFSDPIFCDGDNLEDWLGLFWVFVWRLGGCSG